MRLALDVARRYYRGEADGTETLAACRVIEPGGEEGPPSPLDIEGRPELDEMLFQPDATLLTQYRFSAGPFGAFEWWWRFVDGRSDSMGLGRVDEPDAVVKIAFQKLIGVRTDSISIYEAIEGGRVDGDVGPLMLLAGLQESPELHAAELACGASGPGLLLPRAHRGSALRPRRTRDPGQRDDLMAEPDFSLPRTTELLEAEIEEGLFTRGAQVAVDVYGEGQGSLAMGDDGRGTPVEQDTVFRVYCTIKPVTVLAVAKLVDDGTLDLDEPLARAPARVPGAGRRSGDPPPGPQPHRRPAPPDGHRARAHAPGEAGRAPPAVRPTGRLHRRAWTRGTASGSGGTWWVGSSRRRPASRCASTSGGSSSSRSA